MTAAAFRALHHGRPAGDPLVLAGPWDAGSARAFADAGFAALATPSAAVAASLGVADGDVPAAEMFAAVARVVRAVDVPVSADLEDGYGLPARELVERILETGAVGCNLEDTDRTTGRLLDPREQADRLADVRAEAGDALFLNARIDSWLRGASDEDARERARLYAAAGADCVYPILAPEGALAAIGAAAGLPVNAMAEPESSAPHRLGRLGADRITFGKGMFLRSMTAAGAIAAELHVG
ncbi:isocitrate lyase/PEP mutase family protein [Streptomyces mobaraensis]|uniref:Isocitrate lyase/phosphoenolpyruvate mutase family protein n=1 Tax=Streptomyces mobaraensis TaxID=35621 RepID=A0A5N5WFI7_STRMB|nr:isocitrate lyase/phosphoenolpyruvate mutase family protein [Streptomyces mobaraensis]KAB7852825.1 isocitrate lyase/phosphoenolpyruvate mutase family protein [Streptomyces mobaraensis]